MSGKMFVQDTVRISREDIIPLLKKTDLFWFVPDLKDIMIGSTGKKASSGDIDLVIDTQKRSKDEMVSALTDLGYPCKVRGSMVSFLVPYRGSNAQIDMMFSSNTEFTKLYYFSDPERSKFTGADRQKLISALSYCHRQLTHDHATGMVIEELGPVWTPTGLQIRKKVRAAGSATFFIQTLGEPITDLAEIQSMLFTGFWQNNEFRYSNDIQLFRNQNFLTSVETISDGMEYYLPYDFRVRVWEKFEQDLA